MIIIWFTIMKIPLMFLVGMAPFYCLVQALTILLNPPHSLIFVFFITEQHKVDYRESVIVKMGEKRIDPPPLELKKFHHS